MRITFSALLLWIALQFAALAGNAAEVPQNLYLVGHLPGGIWKSNTYVTGQREGDRFYFRNVSFNHTDNWGQASFGFITETDISPINPSDYFYSSRPDAESTNNGDVAVVRDGGGYAMYKSYANDRNERKNGWELPDKGTYDFTVDFTDASDPRLYVYIKTGEGDTEERDILDDYSGGGHPADGFWIRIGDSADNGKAIKKFEQNGNVYTIDISASEIGVDNWFKISTNDGNWSQNYGYAHGAIDHDVPFAVSPQCQGVDNNFICGDWGDFTIRFYYHGANVPTPIYFLPRGYEGDMPPVMTPEPAGLSGTLPVLYINVYAGDENSPQTMLNDEIIDPNLNHKNYFENAVYWLDKNGCDWMPGESLGSAETPLPLDIKARGNWTMRGFSKKPFKLKLGSKQSLLGLSKSKHFAILAHADDNAGYLRNFVGFNLGKRIGLPWTPSQQPVEVVINGNYRGVYFLTESIRVEKGRIGITEGEDEDTDMANVTGGYLIEFDNYADEAVWQRSDGNAVWHDPHRFSVYVTPDTPETYSDIQRTFVSEQMSRMHELVGNHNPELWGYIDLDDAVRYYLVEEIIGHYEAYHGSTYLFRDLGEGRKWHFSPLWDCGHAFEGGTQNYFYDSQKSMGNTWIRCLKDTEGFDAKLKETWKWFMSQKFDGLYDDIDAYCSSIAAAARADHDRWKDAPLPQYTGWEVWPVQDNSDMDARKAAVKSFLTNKIDWLRQQWGDFAGIHGEPARDATPAATLDTKYLETLPVDYEWNESFLTEMECTHSSAGNAIVLGNVPGGYHVSLDKPAVAFVNTYGGYAQEDASVSVSDNGDITLHAPVPSVYNVTLTMPRHKEGEKTTYNKSTLKQKVTVKPTFEAFRMSGATIDTETNVISVTTTQPLAMQVWSPYADISADDSGFDELYYRVEYDESRESAPARAAGEYPYGMTKYDPARGIDLNYAKSLEMAVKVNGAPSDNHRFSFDYYGNGIVTGIGTVENAPDARWYDLQGMEIAAPTAPGVYIRVAGGSAAKVVLTR